MHNVFFIFFIKENLGCPHTAEVISAERKEKTEKSPLLFDLTTLQREANRRYGYSADKTLKLAQALSMLTLEHTDVRCAVYNVAHFYDPLREQLDRMAALGFYRPDKRARIAFPEDLEQLKAALEGGIRP